MLSNGSIYLQLETHVFYQYKLSKFGTNFFKKRVIFLPKKKTKYMEREIWSKPVLLMVLKLLSFYECMAVLVILCGYWGVIMY